MNKLLGPDKWSSIAGYGLSAAIEILQGVDAITGQLGFSPKTVAILHSVALVSAVVGRVLNLKSTPIPEVK